MATSVSVVVPTYKRPDAVEACLETLLAQTLLPDEIVLVDDSPDKQVRKVQRRMARNGTKVPIRFLANPGRASLTRARNLGVAETKGDIVAFFDSDSLVDPGYLETAVRFLEATPAAMAVRGIEAERDPDPFPYRVYRAALLQRAVGTRRIKVGFPPTNTRYAVRVRRPRPSPSMKGSNMVIRRTALEKVRFDEAMERYCFYEDLDFALSLRRAFPHSIYVHPGMRVRHVLDERGRIPDEDLWLMTFAYKHYLAYKHYKVGPLRRLKLDWSDLGLLVVRSERDPKRLRALYHRYKPVREILRRHEADLRAGRLEAINQYFTWMPGPDQGA